VSAVKRVEFVCDKMSYVILRGRWCNIIVLSVHAPTEDKIDDIKDRFYEELEQVFDKFPNYHMKILHSIYYLFSLFVSHNMFRPYLAIFRC
jgi:hypothetical protein